MTDNTRAILETLLADLDDLNGTTAGMTWADYESGVKAAVNRARRALNPVTPTKLTDEQLAERARRIKAAKW